MKFIFRLMVITTLTFSALVAEKEASLKNLEVAAAESGGMFSNGKISGELRSVYASYDQGVADANDTFATALGAYLKYELAEVNGFGGAMAFNISNDVGSATGDDANQNDELSSSSGEYTVLNEAYINFKNGGFNLRAGRQIIDTPLADSDDIRMIKNSFEAYIATYESNNLSFMLGKLEKWQGVDAGLLDKWDATGVDGTLFVGVTVSADISEVNVWYYNVTELTKVSYFDVSLNQEINSDMSILWAIQSLSQSEINNSGVEASIFGALVEFSAYGLGLSIAHNKSDEKPLKASFSGFGGGTLFTNMDTMILDEIAVDRDASALVIGISYEIGNLTLMYAKGDFIGASDSLGAKAHIAEQNFGLEYSIVEDELTFSLAYTIEEDKEGAVTNENDWVRGQATLSYIF